MAASASTVRLRITYAFYAALLMIAAVRSAAPLPPLLDLLAFCASLALVTLACLGRIWCSAFIAGHKDQRLITTGPYSLCRHPLYALSWIGGVGLGLATRSVTLTLITALTLALLYARAARAEDAELSRMYGAKFETYARATPSWWPSRKSYRLPDSIDVRPIIFRKAFLDAGSFVVLYLAFETVHRLRGLGLFPALIRLP